MAGVKLVLAQREQQTDAAGNFQFLDVPSGVLTLSIDTTPVDPALPMYAVDVTLEAGALLELTRFVHHPVPPAEAFTALEQAAAEDQVFESIDAPGASADTAGGRNHRGLGRHAEGASWSSCAGAIPTSCRCRRRRGRRSRCITRCSARRWVACHRRCCR